MMEDRTREHESVHKRDRYANVDAASGRTQHAARGRPVDVELVAKARIAGRDREWLAVDDKADVTDVAFVENAVNLIFIVGAALGEAAHLGAIGGGISVHLRSTITSNGGRSKVPLLVF